MVSEKVFHHNLKKENSLDVDSSALKVEEYINHLIMLS